MVVAVVQVVDHADVPHTRRLEPLDDGDLVLRLAEPAAVVVEGERTADPPGLGGEGLELGRGRGDPPFLLGSAHPVTPQVEQDPELRLDAVPLEQVENDPRFAIELTRCHPEGIERDPVPLEGLDLSIEAGNMLGPPVVGEVFEAQPLEHRRRSSGPRFFESKGTMHQAIRLSRANSGSDALLGG